MDNKQLDEAVEVMCGEVYSADWLCDGDEGHNGVINNQLRDQMRAALLAGMKVLLGPKVDEWRGRVTGIRGFHRASWFSRGTAEGIEQCADDLAYLYAPSLGEGDGR